MGDIVDELLRYGLFFGAIFQLVCIAAVVFIPPKEESLVSAQDSGESSDEEILPENPSPQHTAHNKHHPHTNTALNRRTRQEKKKRR